MELNIDFRRPTWAQRFDLAAAAWASGQALYRITLNVGAKTVLLETALTALAATTRNQVASCFMELVFASCTITLASEDMAGTVLEIDSNKIEHEPQPPSKTALE